MKQAQKAKLLNTYSENLSHSSNRNNLMRYAREYLESTDSLGRESISSYLSTLVQRKKSPATVNYAFRAIRRLFAVNGIEWDYKTGEAPPIKQRDEYRPQLDPEVIADMITAAKNGVLYTHESYFLALSTIYALRRGEMSGLRGEDFNLDRGYFYVSTLKAGRERYHLIPEEIVPYIEAHDFNQHYATATVSRMFKRILRKACPYISAKDADRIGWHAVRRSVYQGLADSGLSLLAVVKFMRWKAAMGDMAMPARYYGNVVIGKKKRGSVVDEAKGDEEIFEKHPFLPLWRTDG